jgi:hypothetical protein
MFGFLVVVVVVGAEEFIRKAPRRATRVPAYRQPIAWEDGCPRRGVVGRSSGQLCN